MNRKIKPYFSIITLYGPGGEEAVNELANADLFPDFFSSVQTDDNGQPVVFPSRTHCRLDFVDFTIPTFFKPFAN